MVKLDGSGKLVWQKAYGSSGRDVNESLVASADGGFISGGFIGAYDGDVSGSSGGAWIFEVK
jgi:hypothetical protein